MDALDRLMEIDKEAIHQYAQLVQMYYNGAWDFNSWERIRIGPQLMEDAVHWLEINAGVTIDKKEVR